MVKDGDTLWDIAGFYYQNPFLWPFIWRANLTTIADPHWIYPDQVFAIPPSPEERITEVPAPEEPVYVPEVTTVPPIEEPAAEVISVVEPEHRIFSENLIHRAGFIVAEDLPYWGKIIGTEPRGQKNIVYSKKMYIDRAEGVQVDDRLTIYRMGKTFTHPKTGKRLGKEVIVLGKASVEEVSEEGARCLVIASYDIIKKGDLVTPYEPVLAPEKVELIPATRQVEGYVVDVRLLPGQKIARPADFAFVDQGEETGIAVGDIFEVYEERKVGGKEMPDITVAKIQVVSVFNQISTGLVLPEMEFVELKRGHKCRLASEAR
jgi:hypothetical protein